ncbi:MAG: hypothetical protein AUG49_04905 [Catenulispora sp. 13_1_20CM_3_70_7]|nr:hypothetical protein [Catenulisporales bacterium]OLE27577.1 MAG: hypothetical protein AUG49_04905 [Catenulispora sp. 13_1_20CM_3_70_7]
MADIPMRRTIPTIIVVLAMGLLVGCSSAGVVPRTPGSTVTGGPAGSPKTLAQKPLSGAELRNLLSAAAAMQPTFTLAADSEHDSGAGANSVPPGPDAKTGSCEAIFAPQGAYTGTTFRDIQPVGWVFGELTPGGTNDPASNVQAELDDYAPGKGKALLAEDIAAFVRCPAYDVSDGNGGKIHVTDAVTGDPHLGDKSFSATFTFHASDPTPDVNVATGVLIGDRLIWVTGKQPLVDQVTANLVRAVSAAP